MTEEISIKSEGQRKLVDATTSPTAMSKSLGVSKQTAARWRTGERLPRETSRQKIQDVYGIDVQDWTLKPYSDQRKGSAPKSNGKPRRKKPLGTPLSDVEDSLMMIGGMLETPGLIGTEKIRLLGEENKAQVLRARIIQNNELLEDRIVREHPFWKRIQKAITQTLKEYPKAARAVADALKGIGV